MGLKKKKKKQSVAALLVQDDLLSRTRLFQRETSVENNVIAKAGREVAWRQLSPPGGGVCTATRREAYELSRLLT